MDNYFTLVRLNAKAKSLKKSVDELEALINEFIETSNEARVRDDISDEEVTKFIEAYVNVCAKVNMTSAVNTNAMFNDFNFNKITTK